MPRVCVFAAALPRAVEHVSTMALTYPAMQRTNTLSNSAS